MDDIQEVPESPDEWASPFQHEPAEQALLTSDGPPSKRTGTMLSTSLSFVLTVKAIHQLLKPAVPQLPQFDWNPTKDLASQLHHSEDDGIDNFWSDLAAHEVTCPSAAEESNRSNVVSDGTTNSETPHEARVDSLSPLSLDNGVKTTFHGELRIATSPEQRHPNVLGVYRPTGAPEFIFNQANFADSIQYSQSNTIGAIYEFSSSPRSLFGDEYAVVAGSSTTRGCHVSDDIIFERTSTEEAPPQNIASLVSHEDARSETWDDVIRVDEDAFRSQQDLISMVSQQKTAHFEDEETQSRYGPSPSDIDDYLDREAKWKEEQHRKSSGSSFRRWGSLKLFTTGVVRSLSGKKPAPQEQEECVSPNRTAQLKRAFTKRKEQLQTRTSKKDRRVKPVYKGRMVISDETLPSMSGRRVRARDSQSVSSSVGEENRSASLLSLVEETEI
ncbi:hypothetical protein EK21DRAFT_115906 [Setomelanomma holmii]|uniref:Uncharacterized protein n=1 Tax=Setomelanomma holmii TaxID=210430 RepID=A0A9P4LJ90_9PLEO|nr:hypothetical protein EK21DRAFT_115906 [Setomelanomma holmii]